MSPLTPFLLCSQPQLRITSNSSAAMPSRLVVKPTVRRVGFELYAVRKGHVVKCCCRNLEGCMHYLRRWCVAQKRRSARSLLTRINVVQPTNESAGKYTNISGSTACSACEAGRYNNDAATDASLHNERSDCYKCGTGKLSSADRTSCESCE